MRCAICNGTAGVVTGWYGVARPLCDRCRDSLRAAYRRGPVRCGTEAALRDWMARMVARRCPANSGQRAKGAA